MNSTNARSDSGLPPLTRSKANESNCQSSSLAKILASCIFKERGKEGLGYGTSSDSSLLSMMRSSTKNKCASSLAVRDASKVKTGVMVGFSR